MAINGFYLFPHPPIIVPEVGKGEEIKIESTSDSMNVLAQEISKKAPETIILISPHGPMFKDALSILYGDHITGDLSQFSAPGVAFEKKIDKQLSDQIYDLAVENNIPITKADLAFLKSYNIPFKLDHGTMVPLYFVDKYFKDYKIVQITYAPLSDTELYDFGKLIYEAAKDTDSVLIASGDLSHRLKDSGPYGYNPDGPIFDNSLLKLLEKGDVNSILHIDKELIENAGECGMRSILILLGAMDSFDFKGELLSYEDTFGVGYGVMKFKTNNSKSENPYVRLVRENLTTYLNTGNSLINMPDYITDEMKNEKRGLLLPNIEGVGTIQEQIEITKRKAGIKDNEDFSIERFKVTRHEENSDD